MLRSKIILAISLGFAAPALAEERVATGVYEGQKFEYVTALGERDTIEIKGKFLKDGDRFKLIVRPTGRVVGEVGNSAVSFMVSKAKYANIVKSLKPAQPQLANAGAAFSAGTN